MYVGGPMAELYEKCLRVGLRMTLPRKIILEVIEAAEDHPDVDEMYRRAVEKDRSISIALTEATIIQKTPILFPIKPGLSLHSITVLPNR